LIGIDSKSDVDRHDNSLYVFDVDFDVLVDNIVDFGVLVDNIVGIGVLVGNNI